MKLLMEYENRWTGYGRTDIGNTRNENQDSFLILDSCGVWCVADGMGGHREGGIASHLVTQALETLNDLQVESCKELIDSILRILQEGNSALRDLSAEFYGDDVIGTTVVILLINKCSGYAIWVGDSRLYRLRGNALELLTRDHTEFESLLEKGLLGASVNEQGHPASHVLTKALGVSKTVDVEVIEFDVESGDTFLICSDGLSNELDQMELAKVIYYSEDKQRTIMNLFNMALARQALDNVTAVIVDME